VRYSPRRPRRASRSPRERLEFRLGVVCGQFGRPTVSIGESPAVRPGGHRHRPECLLGPARRPRH
jgi:hypothetical protein